MHENSPAQPRAPLCFKDEVPCNLLFNHQVKITDGFDIISKQRCHALHLNTFEARAQGREVLFWKAGKPKQSLIPHPPTSQEPELLRAHRYQRLSGLQLVSATLQVPDPPPHPCTGPATCTSSLLNTQGLLSSHAVVNHE